MKAATGKSKRKHRLFTPPSKTRVPWCSLVGGVESRRDALHAIEQGLSFADFEELAVLLDISHAVLGEIVFISHRTLSRRKKAKEFFKADESDRILRVARLFDRSVAVLGSQEEARGWLKEPQRLLGGQTPLEFMSTEVGAREVEDLLGRIEYGVFS